MGSLDFICSILIECTRRRKASKCKKLIKLLKHRLIIQTNRRNTKMRHSRGDIAQLIKNGQHQSAFDRVQELHKDQYMLLAYDQVEKFCDCVLNNIDEITSQRKLSGDVCEAVSSLIFAASRCGDMPELQSLRYFFTGIFGQKFERANVELLPENRVSSEIKHNLSIKSVPEEVKTQIVNEILRERERNLVQEPTFSEDSSDAKKVQIQTKKFGEMLPEIDPNVENVVTFLSNSHDDSDSIASSFASEKTNTGKLQENDDENFKTEDGTIGISAQMDTATPRCHDKEEQPQQRDDSSRADQFNAVGLRMRMPPYLKAVNRNCDNPIMESPFASKETNAVILQEKNEGDFKSGNRTIGIEKGDSLRVDPFNTMNSPIGLRARGSPYLKAVNKKCHGSIRNDLTDLTNYPSASAIPAQSSRNEKAVGDKCGHPNGVIGDQCSPNDRRACPRSPHVHPKLPEYDDLVAQFRNLKERASGRKF